MGTDIFRVVSLSLVGILAGASARIPTPPERRGPVFPEWRFSDQADARDTVIPMDGSLPVTLHGTADEQVLSLPGNFRGTDHDRCSWDIKVTADLALAKGIRFLFYAESSEPVSSFAIYFHSGNGWYRANFAVARDGVWEEVVVDKSSTASEEKPGGWATIDTIRISAWRARNDLDTTFGLAHLGPVGADASIIVLRGDSVSEGPETKTISAAAERLTLCLDELGLKAGLLADLDCTPARLRGRRLVILPYNPSLPDSVVEALSDFVASGGKLMAFYSFPDPLPQLLGMRRGEWVRPETGHFQGMSRTGKGLEGQPEFVGQGSWNAQVAHPVPGRSRTVAVWRDGSGRNTDLPAVLVSDTGMYMGHILLADDWDGKRRLMLSMVGALFPDAWTRAAEAELARIGDIGPHRTLTNVRRAISGLKADPRAMRALNRADSLEADARRALEMARYETAITQAQAAQSAALRAWCLSRPSLAGEHRAFWCHSAFGLHGKTWDEAITFLAENGFNAILPNMLWGGVAFYPSEVLPAYADLAEKGDQVKLCLEACRKHDVECHVWKVNWNMGSRTDAAFVERMRESNRVQKAFDGSVRERWLCPSHPDNQTLEIESMVELVRNYPVDGIHFDYIRYPGRSFCFCNGCRQRFEASLGRSVSPWPEGIRADDAIQTAWLQWRRDNITRVVSEVSSQARAIRPEVEVSAAVFRNWPTDRDNVAQDWRLWCERGYLDFVCPMDYTESNQTFRNFVRNQMEWSSGKPCYPGIGLSCWTNPCDTVKLIEQIEITRAFNTGGFTVFNFGPNVEQVLPYCALGTTAE